MTTPQKKKVETRCQKHGTVFTIYCEKEKTMICDKCVPEHTGLDHKKVFIKDYAKSLPPMVSAKLKDYNAHIDAIESTVELRKVLLWFYDNLKKSIDKGMERIIEQYPWREVHFSFEEIKEDTKRLDELKKRVDKREHDVESVIHKDEIEERIKRADDNFNTLDEIEEKLANTNYNIRLDHPFLEKSCISFA